MGKGAVRGSQLSPPRLRLPTVNRLAAGAAVALVPAIFRRWRRAVEAAAAADKEYRTTGPMLRGGNGSNATVSWLVVVVVVVG